MDFDPQKHSGFNFYVDIGKALSNVSIQYADAAHDLKRKEFEYNESWKRYIAVKAKHDELQSYLSPVYKPSEANFAPIGFSFGESLTANQAAPFGKPTNAHIPEITSVYKVGESNKRSEPTPVEITFVGFSASKDTDTPITNESNKRTEPSPDVCTFGGFGVLNDSEPLITGEPTKHAKLSDDLETTKRQARMKRFMGR